MKMILAILPPDHLNRVMDSLAEHHVRGLTVSEASGFGQEHDTTHPEHRQFFGIEHTRKIRLEIACRDEEVEELVKAIYDAAHTGQRGDGKIFVLPVLDAMRVKTGERGDAALGQ